MHAVPTTPTHTGIYQQSVVHFLSVCWVYNINLVIKIEKKKKKNSSQLFALGF